MVRLLPPDLCPSASLTGAMPRSGGLCWSDSDLVLSRLDCTLYLAKYVTKRDEEPGPLRTAHTD